MNGLQTARVVIVDDDFAEIEPLLRGLSTLGIGAFYFNGDDSELPSDGKPLQGIRLVFLDLHLIDGSGVGHGALANTVGVLMRIIPEKKGEVGIVCWTKHAEDKAELEAMLKERVPKLEPAFILCLSKQEFIPAKPDVFAKLIMHVDAMFGEILAGAEPKSASDTQNTTVVETLLPLKDRISGAIRDAHQKTYAGEAANIAALRGKIENIFNELPSLRLVWEWEQAVHNAANDATSLLHEIAEARKEGESRENALIAVLASLAKAAGGDTITTPAIAAACLFEGMNPVHADFLDQLANSVTGNTTHYIKLLEIIQEKQNLTPVQKAQTNAAILTAKLPENPSLFQPGNLYVADPEKVDGCPHVLCKIDKFELAYGLIKSKPDAAWMELNKKILGWKKIGLTPEQVEQFKAEQRAQEDAAVREILSKCFAAVLEVTPACDFANKKFSPARFVGCLIVPHEQETTISESDFVRRIKPLTLHSKDGIWHILLNSRFMFGVSNPRGQIKTTPLVRIRLPVLIDIQAWLAAQGARPGYIGV